MPSPLGIRGHPQILGGYFQLQGDYRDHLVGGNLPTAIQFELAAISFKETVEGLQIIAVQFMKAHWLPSHVSKSL